MNIDRYNRHLFQLCVNAQKTNVFSHNISMTKYSLQNTKLIISFIYYFQVCNIIIQEFCMKTIRLLCQRIITISVILLSTSSMVFAASSQRAAIDEYLKSYENIVMEAEKAAKKNKMADLLNVQDKVLETIDEAQKVQSFDEWTTDDSIKYLDLSNRYTSAISKIYSSRTPKYSF